MKILKFIWDKIEDFYWWNYRVWLKYIIEDRRGRTRFSKRWFEAKWFILRNGWDKAETWSLDYEITKFIVPRLKQLKNEFQEIGSHPMYFKTQVEKEYIEKGYKYDSFKGCMIDKKIRKKVWEKAHKNWIKTLDEMIFGFEDVLNENNNYDEWGKYWGNNWDKIVRKFNKIKTEKEKKEYFKTLELDIEYKKFCEKKDYNMSWLLSDKAREYSLKLLQEYFFSLWW